MRTRVWCTSLMLASLAVACGDQPTEVVPEREMTQGSGIIALATSSSDDGLSITTDKDDYQPGDTVWFTGAGWPANDTLDIVLEDEPTTHEPHRWWAPVRADGTFQDSTYVVDVGDIDVTFTLTATSRATGRSLAVVFTDGTIQNNVNISPASVTVTPGNSANYTVTVNFTGNNDPCTANLSASGLPTGAAATFNPTSVTGANNNTPKMSALTITTTGAGPSATPAGSHTFTVTATRASAGCDGQDRSASGTLVVNAPGNNPPMLDPIGNKMVAEETQLAFTATATDDNPGLTFSLANPATGTFPTGAQITAASAFTWTPTEAQGPGTYRVKVVVTDAGLLTDDEEIQIIVTEVNLPPVLADIGPKTIDEETELAFTATATDPDVPANTLTFSLQPGTDAVPTGADINSTTGAFTWTPIEAQGPGVYKFKVRVTDNGVDPANLFDEEEITVTVNEVNKPPVLGLIGPKSVNEGSLLAFTATATDPDIPENTLTFSIQTGGTDLASAAINPTTGAFTWTPADDNPSGTASDNYSVKVVVTDNGTPAKSADETITVTVNNVAPVITSLTLPVAPVAVNTAVALSATFTDQGTNDTHTASINWDAGSNSGSVTESNGSGSVSGSYTYTAAGIYTVALTVTDDDTGADTEVYQYVVVYDPSAGFVTGGGWINSPAGAYAYDLDLTGKATFGFVSKYLTQGKDKTPQLTGNTEFQFHAGNLNFKSTSYDWLVVSGYTKATYKGAGTINGSGDYKFLLAAYDGQGQGGDGFDKFRIKIWTEDAYGNETVYYDNEVNKDIDQPPSTVISGGSIILHVPKNK